MSLFENILWISRDVLEVVSLKKVGYLGYGLKCSGPETHVPEFRPFDKLRAGYGAPGFVVLRTHNAPRPLVPTVGCFSLLRDRLEP
jgi:hypothetical protein